MTMLRLTGINTYTEELRLPAEPPGTGAAAQSCLGGNLQAWEQVGYTQGLVATGWRQMLTASQRAFPDKTFNLALITDNGFPAFLPNGTPVSSPAAAVQQASLVIVTNLTQITAQQFPGQLVIQSNGLEDPRTARHCHDSAGATKRNTAGLGRMSRSCKRAALLAAARERYPWYARVTPITSTC